MVNLFQIAISAYLRLLFFGTFLVTITGVTQACISGSIDTITQTSDGDTYVFVGDQVMKIKDEDSGIVDGYPKPIWAVFQGVPPDLDAAVLWPNGKTYFFKGNSFWTSTGTSVNSPDPRPIAAHFQGIPPGIIVDAVTVWTPNNSAYFFQGDRYWRFDIGQDMVNLFSEPVSEGWPGIGTPVDAAFAWRDGKTYFFSGEKFWAYNDENDEAEDGYPLLTTENLFGCFSTLEDPPIISVEEVCVPDVCSEDPVPPCLKGDLDAITYINTDMAMGNIYAFRGMMVARLTEAAGDIDYGFPRPICSVFPGLPSNIDAALTWDVTGKTYFFKGDDCYRFTGFQMDPDYPRPIITDFPGIPSDIGTAVVTVADNGDEETFFFKDTMFYRFDRDRGTVAPGYPQAIRNQWNGLPNNLQGASSFQWINKWTYFLQGEQYFRWDYVRGRVADGYPQQISKTWFGCRPQSDKNTYWIRQCS